MIKDYSSLSDIDLNKGILMAVFRWDANEAIQPIPDYCNSLDAMHELEKFLPPLDDPFCSFIEGHPSWMYGNNLKEILGLRLYDNGRWIGGHIGWLPLLWATARQKAEAFLKTMEDYNERKKQKGL